MKRQDETLNKVKKVLWPAYLAVFVINSLLMVGYYR